VVRLLVNPMTWEDYVLGRLDTWVIPVSGALVENREREILSRL
jgi:hypothetical protein